MSKDVYRIGMFKLPACFAEPLNDANYWSNILKWRLGLPSKFKCEPLPISYCHRWLLSYQRGGEDRIHPLIKLFLDNPGRDADEAASRGADWWVTDRNIQWLADDTFIEPLELRNLEAFIGLADFDLECPTLMEHIRLTPSPHLRSSFEEMSNLKQFRTVSCKGIGPILHDILLEEACYHDREPGVEYNTQRQQFVEQRAWFKSIDFGLKLNAVWLNQTEAANRLCISPNTLRNWRVDGKGPRFHHVGRRVLYRAEDLDAFARAGASRAVVLSGRSNAGLLRSECGAS